MYELQYKKKAIKALAKINDPYYTNIIEAINELAENPRPFGYKKLTGRDGYNFAACRSGGLSKPKLLVNHSLCKYKTNFKLTLKPTIFPNY